VLRRVLTAGGLEGNEKAAKLGDGFGHLTMQSSMFPRLIKTNQVSLWKRGSTALLMNWKGIPKRKKNLGDG